MKKKTLNNGSDEVILRRRNNMEALATVALILIALAIMVPLFFLGSHTVIVVMRWVYLLGAVLYTVARIVPVNLTSDPLTVRRLRRMEVWGGVAFLIGAGFWFYNASRFGEYFFSMGLMQNTVAFTMAGAVIQMVASWLVNRKSAKKI